MRLPHFGASYTLTLPKNQVARLYNELTQIEAFRVEEVTENRYLIDLSTTDSQDFVEPTLATDAVLAFETDATKISLHTNQTAHQKPQDFKLLSNFLKILEKAQLFNPKDSEKLLKLFSFRPADATGISLRSYDDIPAHILSNLNAT